MFVRNNNFLAVLLTACCLLISDPATAQIVYGQEASGGLDIIATNWKMTVDTDEVTINQWALPASVFVPLRDNLEARIYVARATTTVKELLAACAF